MFDLERFRILLRGEDTPKNAEEQSWLNNYYENQRLSAIKRVEEERQYRINKEKAYHEFYDLIKSSFPQDTFIKKPITQDQYWELYKEASKIAGEKTKAAQKSRLLQIRYGILEVPRSDVEAQVFNSLFRQLTNETICKKLGASHFLLWHKYQKLCSKDFENKVRAIEKKYKVKLYCGFNVEDWCTDYTEYRDYKA